MADWGWIMDAWGLLYPSSYFLCIRNSLLRKKQEKPPQNKKLLCDPDLFPYLQNRIKETFFSLPQGILKE